MIQTKQKLSDREQALDLLADALGPVGMMKLVTENDPGSGDYTKEKYDRPEPTIEEIEAFLAEHKE